ncbi:chemotaxis protein CheC [Vagococcus sp.]|uniref:chemotaxis protein CheC n=1 Tax=Vagococcus sp. TaxID=1933889 RepID=UPI003F975DFC
MMSEQIDNLRIDVLKELINIGGGNAATSISKIINHPVNMRVPLIEVMAYQELYEKIMSEDEQVYAIINQVYGDAEGIFLFSLTEDAAGSMTQMMISKDIGINEELKESAIKELVNIIVNSFLMALSKELNCNLVSSVPQLTIDMFGSVISSLYMELGQFDEQLLIIKNEFLYLGDKIDASLYFIPYEGTLEKLFKSIGL